MVDEPSTVVVTRHDARPIKLEAPRFSLTHGETTQVFTQPKCTLGSHPSNDFVIEDETVSRFHCVIQVEARGFRVIDDGSRNGTWIDGVEVNDGWLRDATTLRLGTVEVRFAIDQARYEMPLAEEDRFGDLVGRSVPMRRLFALLSRVAPSDATVLIEGETGTGKEATAEAIHAASKRREGPFVVVDAGALPPTLLESELFGHEKGAFTGAMERRIGAFEAASGGTVFLDEVGELPPDLQPKLLRVLERKTVRRVGATAQIPVDVRILAATHRNLREAVNQTHFRADLFYRLAVVQLTVPALRDRLDDLELLVASALEHLGATPAERERFKRPGFLDHLRRASWPGNVRELRNYVERCMVLDDVLPIAEQPVKAGVDPTITYPEARRRALEHFEREYLEALLAHHGGNVSQAARSAAMNRPYLYRLLRRHGLK
ncbi:MAG: sigma 54-interacting transcriptional regulator [Myxococcota bacterium]